MHVRDERGMLFCLGAGQRKKISGLGRAGQGVKSLGQGRVTVGLGAFLG